MTVIATAAEKPVHDAFGAPIDPADAKIVGD
jgi:hypothetical protein